MQNLFFGNPTFRETVSRANVMNLFPAASHRLLLILKTRGPQTMAELGVVLGITPAAVRSQLTKLAAEGLATATSEACGVGRPAQFWSLTSEGNAPSPTPMPISPCN